VTKTISKLFRDQYMEAFEIGRGKFMKRVPTDELSIDES